MAEWRLPRAQEAGQPSSQDLDAGHPLLPHPPTPTHPRCPAAPPSRVPRGLSGGRVPPAVRSGAVFVHLCSHVSLAVGHATGYISPSLIHLPRPQSQAGHVYARANFTMQSKLQRAYRVICEEAQLPLGSTCFEGPASSPGPFAVPALPSLTPSYSRGIQQRRMDPAQRWG